MLGSALSLWVLWFIAYATIYVAAGNTFLMQGENMWPFGKSGCHSASIQIC